MEGEAGEEVEGCEFKCNIGFNRKVLFLTGCSHYKVHMGMTDYV